MRIENDRQTLWLYRIAGGIDLVRVCRHRQRRTEGSA